MIGLGLLSLRVGLSKNKEQQLILTSGHQPRTMELAAQAGAMLIAVER